MNNHEPVLLREALDNLNITPGGAYVDATFGRGGHSAGILERLGKQGRLIAFDRDPEAITAAENLFGDDQRFSISQLSFSQLDVALSRAGCIAGVDGILLDLGVSSPQLDNPKRGFSFTHAGPLDMRMDTSHGQTAAEWLAVVSERELAQVIREFGEERYAKRIARAIVGTRLQSHAGPKTTNELAEIVASAVPSREVKKHPATRTFQAIRIYLNRELEELQKVLPLATDALRAGGRVCVISFHSLEDRIAKRFLRRASQGDPVYAGLPDIPIHARPTLKLVGKAIKPSTEEIGHNPRARSSVLRVAERLS